MRLVLCFALLASVAPFAEPIGHDFAVVKGPVEFTMGSPESDVTYFPQQRRDNVGFRVARTIR